MDNRTQVIMSKFNELINSNLPVLIDFHAEWCGPCKTLSPIIKSVKSEMGDSLKVVKVDVDKNQGLASKLGIRGVPTLMLYKSGQLLWRQSGVLQKDQLVQILNQHLS